MDMDVETLNALFFGQLSADDALSSGRVQLEGDQKAPQRFFDVFAFQQPVAEVPSQP